MTTARSILFGIVILAGPVAIFCVLAALPFDDVSWLGGGIIGMVVAMAIPGVVCIALLKLPWWQRAIAAILYLAVYVPVCLVPGFLATCLLAGCAV